MNIQIEFVGESSTGMGFLYYCVEYEQILARVKSDIRIPVSCWDSATSQFVGESHEVLRAQQLFSEDLLHFQQILTHLQRQPNGFTVYDIVALFKLKNCSISVLGYIRFEIERMRENGRWGTALNYERTLNSLSKFLAGKDLRLEALTVRLIDAYSTFLTQNGVMKNSISFYMRNLRAIYNRAVRQSLVRQSSPFRNVYTGIAQTRKRALSEQVVSQVCHLDLTDNPQLAFARDLYIFSYCMRGMAFVDMAYLSKDDVYGDKICYVRRKTGRLICVKIEECVSEIIKRYACMTTGSRYLLPIIKSENRQESYLEYRKAINKYNHALKKISSMLSCPCRLTSYTSRHSWATAAHRQHVPISLISNALGHSSEQVTRIYLATMNNNEVDCVNQRLVQNIWQISNEEILSLQELPLNH